MQGIETRPVHTRRKSISGPCAGGLQVAAAGPRVFTASTPRGEFINLPYAARIAAIGWFAELNASVATLIVTTAVLPNGIDGQVTHRHLASTGSQTNVDLVAVPSGIMYLNDTTGKDGITYLSSDEIHAGTGNLDTARGIWVRAGISVITGTSVTLSLQVYYWPTDHVYDTGHLETDRGFD